MCAAGDVAAAAADRVPTAGGVGSGGLLLYVLVGPGDEKVAVDLSPDATIQDLKAAAHAAGGPKPHEQRLTVGGQQLRGGGATPLSDTDLISSEAVVAVCRKRSGGMLSCGFTHAVVVLEGGELFGWGADERDWSPVPDFGGSDITSVHAGKDGTAAIVDGRLHVWGNNLTLAQEARRVLEGKEIVSCSYSMNVVTIGAVDADGHVYLLGDVRYFAAVPSDVQGSAAAVSLGFGSVAILTRDGNVVSSRRLAEAYKHADFGCRAASVSNGAYYHCVVLEDGSVRSVGNKRLQQRVPSDLRNVVTSCCTEGTTVTLGGDGVIRWFGTPEAFEEGSIGRGTETYVAVAAGNMVLAATADGALEAAWSSSWASYAQELCRVPDLGGRRIACS
eukprot:TRINITY_DN5968_c0_g1_i11.p1 TRINITY_DN5968_c0_g1~~TRINITY_DN5968_c0_g1_i11.p1  ORF type:complete len:389 (+),score=93.60 TRINITY_DN5968_c0_g1_i11:154-1320(+)